MYALDALCVLRCEGGDDRGAVAPEGHERLQVCLERRVGQFPSWYDIILLDSSVDCELVTSNWPTWIPAPPLESEPAMVSTAGGFFPSMLCLYATDGGGGLRWRSPELSKVSG